MDEEKKEPLTQGKVVEESKFSKAIKTFLAEDVDMISDSLMDDYIKPRLKDFGKEMKLKLMQFAFDSVTDCLGMIIFGKGGRRKSNGTYYYSSTFSAPSSQVSYETYYEKDGKLIKGEAPKDDVMLRRVVIVSYGKAKEVLDVLNDYIQRYRRAYVADYYQKVGLVPSKTDFNYGWTDLSGVNILPYRDGYIIDLPKPIPIQ